MGLSWISLASSWPPLALPLPLSLHTCPKPPVNVCGSAAQLACGHSWTRSCDLKRSRRGSSLIPWMSTAGVELLSSFLALCPKRRPSASSALKAEYFAPLPAEQRPGPTAIPSTAVLDSTFSFESSSISIKDLRELFADDLHRFAMAEGRTLAEGSLRAIPSQPQQSRLSVALANVLRHNESHMTAAWDRDVQDFETVVANWIDSVVVALKRCQRGLQKQFDSGGHTETAGERLTADGRADEGLDTWSA